MSYFGMFDKCNIIETKIYDDLYGREDERYNQVAVDKYSMAYKSCWLEGLCEEKTKVSNMVNTLSFAFERLRFNNNCLKKTIDKDFLKRANAMILGADIVNHYRLMPITIQGFPLAIFPYPREIDAIVDRFLEWIAHQEHQTEHQCLLFAADTFLNFTQIHPFADGNGRLGRLLSAMVMLSNHLSPVVYTCVKSRDHYNNVIFSSQQLCNRLEFYQLFRHCFLYENHISVHNNKDIH
jgi:Fic family protein